MGYTKEAIKGISWVGAFRASSRGVALLRTVVLARILTPSQFGLVGIATLVLGFIEMLTETGINIFLIQEEKSDRYLDTAWIVSITRGIVISILILVSAVFVSQFFHAPESLHLLFLIAMVPFIRGFINPAIVNFQKELAFDKEFWFRLSIFSLDSLTAIILALITREAVSLVWGFIVGALLEVFLSQILIRPRPRLSFEMANFKAVLNRGKWVTAYSLLNYTFQNLDSIVVGRMLGAFPLGLYQVGYKIANIPGEAIDSISRVTFPVFAKIAGDKTRLKRAFWKTTKGVSFLTISFGLILFFLTEPIVSLTLGLSWLEVVPALKVLAILGMVRAIVLSSSPLFLSLKKQKYVTIFTLASVIGLAIAIVPLVSGFGLVGAAFAALIGVFLAIPVVLYYIFRIFR